MYEFKRTKSSKDIYVKMRELFMWNIFILLQTADYSSLLYCILVTPKNMEKARQVPLTPSDDDVSQQYVTVTKVHLRFNDYSF